MDDLMYLQNKYKDRIMKILNDQEISLIEREFYAESPNWYTNQDLKSMIDTLIWLTYDDKTKKNLLDKEFEDYFKNE
jgi:hypothetical protein